MDLMTQFGKGIEMDKTARSNIKIPHIPLFYLFYLY